MPQPVVVAYGAGRDSTAMLIEMWKRKWRPDAILFANVGSEKRATYDFIPVFNQWLLERDFPPITIVQYQPVRAPYRTLEGNMIKNATLPGAAFNRHTCALKMKIEPQNKWTRKWLKARVAWGLGMKVVKLIGFECSEVYRLKRADARAHAGKGTADAQRYEYRMPLMDWGYDLDKCMEIIDAEGLPMPPKSACYFCPFQKTHEVDEATPEDRARTILMELVAEPYNKENRGLWRQDPEVRRQARLGDRVHSPEQSPLHALDAQRLMPQPLLGAREAIRLALQKSAQHDVETVWSDAGTIPGDPDWAGGTVFTDRREIEIKASPETVFRAVCRIGGGHGWYAADWLWRIRGWIDLLLGGPGLRRGRRNPEQIAYGDALDFWRVIGIEEGRRLCLRAEMKLPGVAELEFRINPLAGEPSSTRLEQVARFQPKGLFGLAYWYAVLPLHSIVFNGMLWGIKRAAESTSCMRVAMAGAPRFPVPFCRMGGRSACVEGLFRPVAIRTVGFAGSDAHPVGRAVLTLVKIDVTFCPRVVMAVNATMMIRASITAYSVAVGPSSDRRKRLISFIAFSFLSRLESAYG